jgi:hypothetical protein
MHCQYPPEAHAFSGTCVSKMYGVINLWVRTLTDWLIDWLALGSSPYSPDAPRPWARTCWAV